jgi:hypothetical protein
MIPKSTLDEICVSTVFEFPRRRKVVIKSLGSRVTLSQRPPFPQDYYEFGVVQDGLT